MMTPTGSRARSRTRARERRESPWGNFQASGARESLASLARGARVITRVIDDDVRIPRVEGGHDGDAERHTGARDDDDEDAPARAGALANLVRRAQNARAPPADALTPLAVRATGGAAEARVRACRRACASEAFAPTCARTIGTFANALGELCAFAKVVRGRETGE